MVRKRWMDLFTAIIVVSVATALRVVFFGDLGRATPYLTYYPAVMTAGIIGGLPAGLLATVPSSLLWCEVPF